MNWPWLKPDLETRRVAALRAEIERRRMKRIRAGERGREQTGAGPGRADKKEGEKNGGI